MEDIRFWIKPTSHTSWYSNSSIGYFDLYLSRKIFPQFSQTDKPETGFQYSTYFLDNQYF
jgi:hypothetical protein